MADRCAFWIGLFAAAAFIVFFLREGDPRRSGKKKLAMTARAKRILGFAVVLSA